MVEPTSWRMASIIYGLVDDGGEKVCRLVISVRFLFHSWGFEVLVLTGYIGCLLDLY